MKTLTTIAILTIGSAMMATAAIPAPEIDPASGMSALALLTGAVLVFRSRKK